MKSKTIIVSILILALFSSCSRHKCWTCKTEFITYMDTGKTSTFGNERIECDLTRGQIKDIEKDGTAGRTGATEKIMRCEAGISGSSGSGSSGSSSGGGCSSVQCSGTTKAGDRCKNKTTNCSGRCYLH